MDPVTQGVIGATLPQSIAKSSHRRLAGLLGVCAGMAADIDVLITSPHDPLLFLEYHRQFTHSLVFIPIGGLICALLFYGIVGKRKQYSLALTWAYCTLGYATHGLLDACTSYGTQLLWPFSEIRVAWDILPIVDPLYTLPLLGMFVIATYTRKKRISQLALAWALIYPTIGFIQHERAEQEALDWAASQDIIPERITVKPTFGNLIVWKSVIETRDTYYTVAIRAGYKMHNLGTHQIERFNASNDFPWLNTSTQQHQDIVRFSHFSDGYMALEPNDRNKIMDVRYSLMPNNFDSLWGIELSPQKTSNDHVVFYTNRSVPADKLNEFKRMIFDQP